MNSTLSAGTRRDSGVTSVTGVGAGLALLCWAALMLVGPRARTVAPGVVLAPAT